MSQNITETIMQQIDDRQVTMRPRWYFTLVTSLSILVALFLGLGLVYIVNIMTVAIKIQFGSTPMYGARDRLADLATTFPWWLVLVGGLAFMALIWIIRRHGRLYRISPLRIIVTTLLISIVLGVALSFTAFGQHQYHQSGGSRHAPGDVQLRSY